MTYPPQRRSLTQSLRDDAARLPVIIGDQISSEHNNDNRTPRMNFSFSRFVKMIEKCTGSTPIGPSTGARIGKHEQQGRRHPHVAGAAGAYHRPTCPTRSVVRK